MYRRLTKSTLIVAFIAFNHNIGTSIPYHIYDKFSYTRSVPIIGICPHTLMYRHFYILVLFTDT
jgi:hypothetical protein